MGICPDTDIDPNFLGPVYIEVGDLVEVLNVITVLNVIKS